MQPHHIIVELLRENAMVAFGSLAHINVGNHIFTLKGHKFITCIDDGDGDHMPIDLYHPNSLQEILKFIRTCVKSKCRSGGCPLWHRSAVLQKPVEINLVKILILEDDPHRVSQFEKNLSVSMITVTDRAEDAINHLKTQQWDVLYLDHDLGGDQMVESGPGTGYEVAVFLEQNPKYKPKAIVIHSLNVPGSMKMKQVLPEAILKPFAWKGS